LLESNKIYLYQILLEYSIVNLFISKLAAWRFKYKFHGVKKN